MSCDASSALFTLLTAAQPHISADVQSSEPSDDSDLFERANLRTPDELCHRNIITHGIAQSTVSSKCPPSGLQFALGAST